MAIIDVSQAQAGMVLAADVLDKRGRVLIPAGKELIEKYVSALPAWGVTRLEIEGDDPAGGSVEVEPWALEEATAEVDRLFSKTNRSHPAVEHLAQVITQRKAHQIQSAVPAGDVA